jgi:gas vesicle protein
MFQPDHSFRNLFLGTFLGITVGALTTLYLGTNGGKRLQKDVLNKLQDLTEPKKSRSKKRTKKTL